MTTYAARHVALEGDDTEPEGLASSWGSSPAPRRALMPDETMTSYDTYEPEPELRPYSAVALESMPVLPESPSEFGRPVVAPVPSPTPGWHLAEASHAPLDPGPAHAATPLTVGSTVDPASVPTPLSQSGAFAYQSMPSPSEYTSVLSPSPYASVTTPAPYGSASFPAYASVPAQGGYAAPVATPYVAGPPAPFAAPAPYEPRTVGSEAAAIEAIMPPELAAKGTTGVKVVGLVQRVYSLVVIGIVVGMFTFLAAIMGVAQVWWSAALVWAVGLFMLVRTLRPRRA